MNCQSHYTIAIKSYFKGKKLKRNCEIQEKNVNLNLNRTRL